METLALPANDAELFLRDELVGVAAPGVVRTVEVNKDPIFAKNAKRSILMKFR